jgi:hypothetical protein
MNIHVCVSADTLVHSAPHGITHCEGVMVPFVRKLLALRSVTQATIEVSVLISSDSLMASGQSIVVGLSDIRVVSDIPPSVDLFLSCDSQLVEAAFRRGTPSACVQDGTAKPDSSAGLKVAFDGDGVLSDRSSEERYRNHQFGSTATSEVYYMNEWNERTQPLGAGPMARFAKKLSDIRDEIANTKGNASAHLQLILCTARNHRALSRMLVTTDSLGIFFDRVFATGHDRKGDYLEIPKAHLFLDDIQSHLDYARFKVACAKVPELNFVDGQRLLP